MRIAECGLQNADCRMRIADETMVSRRGAEEKDILTFLCRPLCPLRVKDKVSKRKAARHGQAE